MKRCEWLTKDSIYIKYHDEEWGVPVHDERKLFEMLLLEGAQAGLNWLTILKRRDSYRIAYDDFDPQKISKWNQLKINRLLKDSGIIRNRLKVSAAKTNAQAYLKIAKGSGGFDEFIWSFVKFKPIQNCWKTLAEIPATSKESDALSKALKERGFKFVGSTICYAFMQAVGLVNDHMISCFRHKELKKMQSFSISASSYR